MRRSAAQTLLAFGALALAGCGGAGSDPGADALMRLSSAQFYRGAPPAPGTDGPAVTQLLPAPGAIRRGPNDSVNGFVDRTASAVLVWLEGDVGYWVVQPGALDISQLNQLGFGAGASYAASLPAGAYTVSAQASDLKGHYGPVIHTDIKTDDVAVNDTLLVSLAWDTEADLDLHLVTPDGTEVWANKINSQQPPVPGQPTDPNGWKNGGILDYDSNGNCVIDGRRQENVFWTAAPPSGHYIARVDTYSMCGQPMATWHLAVTNAGQPVGLAAGFSRDSDASYFTHGAGAGIKALEFDIP